MIVVFPSYPDSYCAVPTHMCKAIKSNNFDNLFRQTTLTAKAFIFQQMLCSSRILNGLFIWTMKTVQLVSFCSLLLIRIFSRGFYFRESSRMRSFVKIKPSRNGQITLMFTDAHRPSRNFLAWKIYLLTLFAKMKCSRKGVLSSVPTHGFSSNFVY